MVVAEKEMPYERAEKVSTAPAFKQTEVGLIPSDWEVKTINDVCQLINGRGFKPYEWVDTGLPIIRIQNLNGSDEFNYYDGQYNPKILVENGQLLFAWSGSRGTSFGPHVWNGDKALLNYHTWKLEVKESKICRDFFLHYLRILTRKIEDSAHGASALVHTQKGEMEKFIIYFPPTLAEQRAIATALSDVDALITGLDALITKKRNIKQGTMQQLLTSKKRLPGFSGEWATKTLGEILMTHRLGGNYANSEVDTNSPLIKMGNLGRGYINLNKIEYITDERTVNENDKLQHGDVLFNTRNTLELVGKVAIWNNELPVAYYNSNLIRLIFKPTEVGSNFFMNYALNTKKSVVQLKEMATGTTSVAAIYTKDLLNFEILMPTKPEQIAIAQILSDMDGELDTLTRKRDKYKAVKQGMMQQLLTGKIRLPVAA